MILLIKTLVDFHLTQSKIRSLLLVHRLSLIWSSISSLIPYPIDPPLSFYFRHFDLLAFSYTYQASSYLRFFVIVSSSWNAGLQIIPCNFSYFFQDLPSSLYKIAIKLLCTLSCFIFLCPTYLHIFIYVFIFCCFSHGYT